jgi:hypothetical protein
MANASEADVFDTFKPDTGYHTAAVITEAIASLSLVKFVDGGINGEVTELISVLSPSPETLSHVVRVKNLADSICRFFHTGGDWHDIALLLKTLKDTIPGGFEFPGYAYVASTHAENGWEHVFKKNDKAEVVIWEEPIVGDNGLPIGGQISTQSLDDYVAEGEYHGDCGDILQIQRKLDSGNS